MSAELKAAARKYLAARSVHVAAITAEFKFKRARLDAEQELLDVAAREAGNVRDLAIDGMVLELLDYEDTPRGDRVAVRQLLDLGDIPAPSMQCAPDDGSTHGKFPADLRPGAPWRK